MSHENARYVVAAAPHGLFLVQHREQQQQPRSHRAHVSSAVALAPRPRPRPLQDRCMMGHVRRSSALCNMVPVSLGFYQCTVCSFSKKCAHVQRRYPFFCHDPKSKSTRDPIYRVPTMEYLLTTSCTLYEIHKFCILPGTSNVAGTC
eukprot:SAG11_NODE_9401_length_915_cov_7.138480_1_plen_147_part_00